MDHLSDREILILTADRLGNLIEKVEIQNGRIGRLESWRLQILGGGLALMALMPFLIVLVNRLFESGG
jgi:hypothetical protein